MTSSETLYRLVQQTGYSVVFLLPTINESQWSDFDAIGDEMLGKLEPMASNSVMVDLTELEYISSAMLSVLLRLWKSTEAANGKMVVVNRHKMIHEVLQIAGLDKIWQIVESKEQAQSILGVGRGSRGAGLLAFLAVLTLLGAAAALIHTVNPSNVLPQKFMDDRIALNLGVGCVVAASILGTALVARTKSWPRVIGVLVLIGNMAVIAAGMLNLPNI